MRSVAIRIAAPLLACAALAACGSGPKTPSDANFRAAINAELAKDNPYCLRLKPGLYRGIPPSPLTNALGKRGLLEPAGTHWHMNEESLKTLYQGRKWPGPGLHACIAEGAEVAAIVNWTEPANLFGKTVTEVTYTMQPTKVAAWITPDIAPLIPHLAEKPERTIALHLTAKGWEVAHP